MAKMFGEKLRRLREERHLSLDELAAKSGLNRNTLFNAEHSDVCTLRPTTFQKLARGLDLTLVELDYQLTEGGGAKKGLTIPVVNIDERGRLLDYGRVGRTRMSTFTIPRGDVSAEDAVAVFVRDDSMSPQFMEGDLLVLQNSMTGDLRATDNRYGIVCTKEDRSYLGRIRFVGAQIIIERSHPEAKPVLISLDDVDRIAVVIELRRKVH